MITSLALDASCSQRHAARTVRVRAGGNVATGPAGDMSRQGLPVGHRDHKEDGRAW